jgi:hypothetical protein
MQGTCRNLPTVEECRAAARENIKDDCLRDCVLRLCVEVTIKCGAEEELPHQHCDVPRGPRSAVGGYVPDPEEVGEENLPPRTCTLPRKIIDWCELDISPSCASKMMVHELCHACGWHHNKKSDGKGVPGITGDFTCNDFNQWGWP